MSNYNKGANFERRVIHDLLKLGMPLIIRGAGSKSYGLIKADIVAIDKHGHPLIIQAKHQKKPSKKEAKAFEFDNTKTIAGCIWWYVQKGKYEEDLKYLKERHLI